MKKQNQRTGEQDEPWTPQSNDGTGSEEETLGPPTNHSGPGKRDHDWEQIIETPQRMEEDTTDTRKSEEERHERQRRKKTPTPAGIRREDKISLTQTQQLREEIYRLQNRVKILESRSDMLTIYARTLKTRIAEPVALEVEREVMDLYYRAQVEPRVWPRPETPRYNPCSPAPDGRQDKSRLSCHNNDE